MDVRLIRQLVPDELWNLAGLLLIPPPPRRRQGGGTPPIDARAAFAHDRVRTDHRLCVAAPTARVRCVQSHRASPLYGVDGRRLVAAAAGRRVEPARRARAGRLVPCRRRKRAGEGGHSDRSKAILPTAPDAAPADDARTSCTPTKATTTPTHGACSASSASDPRIARRGIESPNLLGRHRWVIERTFTWFTGYHRLTIRFERSASLYCAFVTLAAALTCHRRYLKLTTRRDALMRSREPVCGR